MDSLWRYAIAGYVVTGGSIGLYVLSLVRRGRAAKERAAAVAATNRDHS